ncbi:hypothetical protein [Yoonia sp. SS1-5]|uniref:Uncharacterized protein n=1 Tax=Yoonia rhodophyticola TaxID=3137370 RepID=A0AAN0MLQ6_9RHOB
MKTVWRYLAVIGCVTGGAGRADPLGLIDYDALFAQHAAQAQPIDATRSVLRLGDISITRIDGTPQSYVGRDNSGHVAIGCFVDIIAQIEAAERACGHALSPSQQTSLEAYRRIALVAYGRNVQPATTLDAVHARYAALVATSAADAGNSCQAADAFDAHAAQVLAPDGRAALAASISAPRLPVADPCF